MNIVFDNIIYSKELQGGISNYWKEITNEIFFDKKNKVLFCDEINALNNSCRKSINIPNELLIKTNYKSDLFARLGKVRLFSDEYFLYHSSFYRPIKSLASYTEVTTVHDFTHDYYSPWLKKKMHNKLKYAAIKRSKGIICVSKNTYSDLKKFCPIKSFQKVEVIYNGVSDDYYQISKFGDAEDNFLKLLGIEKNYFLLFVGSRSNYKNFEYAVKLLTNLDKLFKLVVVGKEFTDNEKRILGIDVINRIVVASQISNQSLNILYNASYALIYPSSYEGFGIPVIEAMKAGCPVIALNKSSIPEIVGKGALLVDDLNIEGFKKEIIKLSSDAFRIETIQAGIEQSKKFSWKKCSKETSDFYKEIY